MIQGMAALAAAPASFAQTGFSFAGKQVKVVVAYAVGGVADITTRVATAKLATALGAESVIVENKAGANGNIGTEYVARQRPDGLTYLVVPSSQVTMNPFVPELRLKSLDVTTQLQPVAPLADTPLALVASAASDLRTFEQFLAKARTSTIRCGNPSSGTPQHLAALLLERANELKFVHVPYKGGAPLIADLAGGHIDACFSSVSSAEALVKQGKLRAIGVVHSKGREPWRGMVSLTPWMHDAIVPSWSGLFAPAGTSPEAIRLMHAAVTAAIQSSGIAARLDELALDPLSMSVTQMQDKLARETRFMREFLKSAKLDFTS